LPINRHVLRVIVGKHMEWVFVGLFDENISNARPGFNDKLTSP
jgi:hypothetical protein